MIVVVASSNFVAEVGGILWFQSEVVFLSHPYETMSILHLCATVFDKLMSNVFAATLAYFCTVENDLPVSPEVSIHIRFD